jgi:enterochelin esterase-like enzyme
VGWSIGYPPGIKVGDRLPVAVVLPGRRSMNDSAFHAGLHLDAFLADAIGKGMAPFALASIDAGDTYFHRRASGEDDGASVVDEFLPMLADRGPDTSRLAFLGWSMGGYGSLLIAGMLGAERVTAVAAASPAGTTATTGAASRLHRSRSWERHSPRAPEAMTSCASRIGPSVRAGPQSLARQV